MTLKTATQLAIGGTAAAMAISLFTQYFSLRGTIRNYSETWSTIYRVLYFLRLFCFEGSLLLFFITLYRTRLQAPGSASPTD